MFAEENVPQRRGYWLKEQQRAQKNRTSLARSGWIVRSLWQSDLSKRSRD